LVEDTVWVVNPDSGSVTILNDEAVLAEVSVGVEPRWVSLSPDGNSAYIVDTASGTLVLIDAVTLTIQNTIMLGPEPAGVVLSPAGDRAYVSLMAANEVVVIDVAAQTIIARIATNPKPYALAISPDGQQLYVTHLLAKPRTDIDTPTETTDDGHEAVISVIDTALLEIQREIVLAPDANGFPNLLTGIAIAGDRAWVPHVRAAPALPAGLTTTIFAATSVLDLSTYQEDRTAFLPLNDQDIFGSPVNNPVAAIPSPDGTRLYIVLAGSDLLEVVDISSPTQPRLVKFLATGKNPQGMALSRDGTRGYVMNYLSRSATVYDLVNLEILTEIQVTDETLDADILRGKILFNNAVDPRLSQGSWVSCASCHFDGLPDGVTWMFPDGPRQTPALWNAGDTLPWHWSAALDEPQDVEETIHLIQHGLGLAPGTDPAQLGLPNGGRSTDLDALAAFLSNGIRAFIVDSRINSMTGLIAEGRTLFIEQGCANCHGGPHWTLSTLADEPGMLDPDGNGMVDAVLVDVGTLNPADIRGESGFDVPSLLGVGLTAPYLHDGSMPTLMQLLSSGHPTPDEASQPLTSDELSALTAFVQSISPETDAIDVLVR
ncbi:MAG: hypothetical protein AAF639_32000, partial [Chloroflexota bacterium]